MKKRLLPLGLLCATCFCTNAQKFEWARNMGNTLSTIGRTVGTDNLGNVYTAGTFNGTADLDPSNLSTAMVTSAGAEDIFLTKFNAKGEYVWSKTIGGTGADFVHYMKIDGAGNIYLTGSYEGTVDFDPGSGTQNLTSNGSSDIYLLKLDNSGNFVWANSYGGSMDDVGACIATSASTVYLTGYFKDQVNFDPSGSAKIASKGLSDIFILKLDATGTTTWIKTIGGVSDEEGKSVTIDSKGDVIFSGYFNGSVDFDPGPKDYFRASDGARDAYVVKLASNGDFKWLKVVGSKAFDGSQTTVVDGNDNVFTVGYFSNLVDLDPGATDDYHNSGSTIGVFIQKLDINGNFAWAKTFNGQLLGNAQCATVDKAGNVFLTGYFNSSIDFGTGSGMPVLTTFGYDDAFIVKLYPSGKFASASKIGGTKYDNGFSVFLNSANELFATGQFSGTADFDPSVNIANLVASSAAVSDAFVMKLSNFPTGISEQAIGGNILMRIAPNPSSGQFTLSLLENRADSRITITDLYGKTVYTLDQPKERNEINLSGYAPGMYFVQLVQQGEVVSGSKIIVQ